MWGVAISAFESLIQPARDLYLSEFVLFTAQIALAYVIAGISLAILATRIEARLSGAATAAAATLSVILAAVLHILTVRLSWWVMPGVGADAMLTFVPELGQQLAHVLWICGFFGSAYLGAYLLARRSFHLRQHIVRAELARAESETRINQARLEDISGLLQPSLLVASIAEIGRRYALDPDDADALLDLQVGFLRAAMPKLQSKSSDLPSELELVSRYVALCRQLGRIGCHAVIQQATGSPRVPFPPLILIPIIEHLGRAVPPNGTLYVSVRPKTDQLEVALGTSALAGVRWLPEELASRVTIAAMAFGITVTIPSPDDPSVPTQPSGALVFILPRDSHFPIKPNERISYG